MCGRRNEIFVPDRGARQAGWKKKKNKQKAAHMADEARARAMGEKLFSIKAFAVVSGEIRTRNFRTLDFLKG